MKYFFLFIAGVMAFSGCSITPSKPQDYTTSSERRLVYTDELVRARGRVFVAHGGRAKGNYPSNDELGEIRVIENALRQRGYSIVNTREDAEYRFETWSNGENGVFPSYSCNLNRYIRSHHDIIKYAGMTELQMWKGEIRINSPNVLNPQRYKMAAYSKIIEMMPNQTDSRTESIANLEG